MKLSESKDMQANVYYRHLGVELGDKLSKDDWVHVVRKQVQKAPISLKKVKIHIIYESERKVKENLAVRFVCATGTNLLSGGRCK